jgi:hypothetical protein
LPVRLDDLPLCQIEVVVLQGPDHGRRGGPVPRLRHRAPDQLTAFALLLTALTGENFCTVARWPAMHYRPDGGQRSGGTALPETTKRRRGHDREHMAMPLEDLPASLATLVPGGDADQRLFRSPLRVYQLPADD